MIQKARTSIQGTRKLILETRVGQGALMEVSGDCSWDSLKKMQEGMEPDEEELRFQALPTEDQRKSDQLKKNVTS